MRMIENCINKVLPPHSESYASIDCMKFKSLKSNLHVCRTYLLSGVGCNSVVEINCGSEGMIGFLKDIL